MFLNTNHEAIVNLCLACSNKLVDQYNNSYHHSVGKKAIDADYSALIKKIETNRKVNDIVRIAKYRNIFSKGYYENSSRELFIINFTLKTNPWTFKIKDTNGKK